MKAAALAVLLWPCAALAQDGWLYAPMVSECAASGAIACVGQAAALCMADTPGGETTLGMVTCLTAEHRLWDGMLNAAYADARHFARSMDAADADVFPAFAVRANQVQAAQRAWIAFRDANCAMQHGVWGAGSMRQIAGADCMLQMTAAQTYLLRDYHTVP